jgi:RNA polymerase sigma-70 factor (ECF subfamily)
MSIHLPDDDALAKRSRRGDATALATLYRRHAPALLDYLERILASRADAEDVLHETFLRLFQGRGSYEARGRFRAWLFTVASHLARDHLRRNRRRRELTTVEALTEPQPQPASPLELAARRELHERIEAALADLPESYAMAFHLRVREDFPYRDIAAICGEGEGTLRSRVHHAVKRITAALRGTRPASPAPAEKKEKER